jgi:hypothetical protein
MRRLPLELDPGPHALNILADSGDHDQPFLLACLDWPQATGLARIGTDDSWHAVVDPPLEWMPDIPKDASLPPELVPPGHQAIEVDELELLNEINAWRRAFPPGMAVHIGDQETGAGSPTEPEGEQQPELPGNRARTSTNLLQDGRTAAFEFEASAYDGVWAEPWGMPANTPDDFCRLSTGWQECTDEMLPRASVTALHQGLTAAGTGVWKHEDGGLRMRPVAPFPQTPPKLETSRPPGRWHQVRDVHARRVNGWLDQYEARAPHAVFDVGEHTFGRVRVRLERGGPGILALTTGESEPEVHRYDRRSTDVFTLNDGESFTTTPTGLRYIKLIALSSAEGMLDIEPLIVQHIRHPVEQVGQFHCSDPLLDRIWEVSAFTLHLCMQNEIWDAIKRDQLPKMGELATEALAAYHLYDDARLVRRTLSVLAELGPAPARPLGRQLYPGLQAVWKTPGGDLNGIPPYTLWWVIGLADYVRYTGDRSLLAEYTPELLATLSHIVRQVGSDGLWHLRKSKSAVPWDPPSVEGCEACCHLLACLALSRGTELVASLGRLDVADYCSAMWMHMVDAARRAWFDSDLQALQSTATSTSPRPYPRSILKIPYEGQDKGPAHHTYAMAIRSGCLSAPEAAGLFRRTQVSDPLSPMTYWHRYGDLEAAAQVGQIQWGLDYLRARWGSALQAGLTTFWETFDPSWSGQDPHGMSIVTGESATYGGYRTAHCHGGAAGPVVWLHRAVLGVTPSQDGFAAIRFTPALGDLDWARGTVPTPRGPIRVSLRRRTGALPSAELTLPPGIQVQVDQDVLQTWEIEELHAPESEREGDC